MSGICGIVGLGRRPASQSDIETMIEPLKRRGPDGSSAWVGDGVALGHTLLATTPEAASETLPLALAQSGCTITADARLDNRGELAAKLGLDLRSRTIGDGEMILRSYLRWGERCVEHFLGDFAFAIWDERARRLLCARDHIGMRQLLYCQEPGKFLLFATEARAVLAHPLAPKEINRGRIADFLEELEAFDLAETFFKKLFRLPPAHILVFDGRGLSCRQYWRPQPQPELRLSSDRDYAEAFLDVFTQAVRCRLRSHRPVGAMMSGGMDSSSVAAVAARVLAVEGAGPLATFSAIGPDADSCAETRAIRAALTVPGIAPTLINHAELDDYLDDLARLMKASDEPFDSQMTLVRAVYLAAHRAGINVVLDGVGGDVMVGPGWTIAYWLRHGKFLQALREARGEAAFWGPSWWPVRKALGHGAWRAYVPHRLRQLRHELTARVRGPGATSASPIASQFAIDVDLVSRRRRARAELSELDGIGPTERALGMAHPFLVAGRERYDRVASALAIEPRDPFVDLRLVRFCLSVPVEQLQRNGLPKLILRRAMADVLPDSVRWRRGKDHLGGAFISKLFRSRPELDFDDSRLEGTIRPFVDLARVRNGRSSCGSSEDFADWAKSVYLGLWLECIDGMLGTSRPG